MRRLRTVLILSAMAACAAFLPSCNAEKTVQPMPSQPGNVVQGTVVDEAGQPISEALVRVKGTDQSVLTGPDGAFAFREFTTNDLKLTAWAPGYYIAGGESVPRPATNLKLVLKKLPDADNAAYTWLSAFSSAGQEGNCEKCHADDDGASQEMPLPQWQGDAHGLSARNARFLSMYRGTDLNGNQSPARQYGSNPDYGSIPLRPDLTQPYYGPGYKLDFPDSAGNCAACHAPAAAANAPYDTDAGTASGINGEGVTCDVCHKVWAVQLDPSSGLPYANAPGVLSLDFRRPAEGNQFFAGPFDDVAPGHDTYTPLQKQSQSCAACHYGVFWSTQVYNSFGEWLNSPYSDASKGKTCQDCHMPQGLNDHFARIDQGAVKRDPRTIFSHRMPGASDQGLLQNAVDMRVTTESKGDRLSVTVSIFNNNTGHDIPTDSPLRQMILLVDARDAQGKQLQLVQGTTVPEWGGVGDAAQGYYAGLPGKGFAKILAEQWTGESPTGAYWNPTRVVSDNRIAAFATDTSQYVFALPPDEAGTVHVRLLFRRAFKVLMDQKGWDTPDILMEEINR